MKTILKTTSVFFACAMLVACGTSSGVRTGGEPAAVEDRTGAAAGAEDGVVTAGVGTVGSFTLAELNNPASPLFKRVIYFEYDSDEVAAEDRETVAAHARLLAANPGVTVTLEGHADERGSREYNIGLGDRRAQAVRKLLEFQGASNSQILTVSYGEERPVAEGHDESAWRLNRRVELVYPGQ
ncbi:MAG: peptidoglycan-associated lipoprotein Pal [Gammaproteobacteria bacterium]